MNKRAIVLDIDENLVHSIVRNKPDLALAKSASFHFQLYKDQYYVFKRPGLDKFLQTVYKEFDYIGIWTTGVKPYAKKVLKHILTLDQAGSNKLIFIYTRQDCARDNLGYYKPLQKVWNTSNKFRPNNTIMMDNTLGVMRYNLDNALLTPHYTDFNLKTDKYLPWLDLQIRKYLRSMTVYNFIKQFSKPK